MAALAFEHVAYAVPARGEPSGRRLVLGGVSGECPQGTMTAILGPSGAGKTTLLRALSGRMAHVSGARLRGRVRLGECARNGVAFVEQSPDFFSCLTVDETARFYASFRHRTRRDAAAAAAKAIDQMGLSRVRHSLVGGDSGGHLYAGISGGEKRRLAVACEVAGMGGDADGGLCVLLADEPTTGLDAAQADHIVVELVRLCREGIVAAALATLHQPRGRTFARVDRCLFLTHNGKVAFEGPTDRIAQYLSRVGYPLPAHTNPAEFVIDLIDVNATFDAELAGAPAGEGNARVAMLEQAWDEQRPRDQDKSPPPASGKGFKAAPAASGGRPPVLRQLRVLLGRSFRQALRDRWVTGVRAVASVGLGSLLGAALGGDALKGGRAVQGRAALLMQLGVNAGFVAICRAITNMPKERSIVTREVLRPRGGGSSGYYHPVPFLVAKLAAELPIDAALSGIMAAVASPIAGLRGGAPRRRLVAGVALHSVSASSLGLLIGAASPSAESAMAVGPCAMVASILISDMSGTFAKCPPALVPLSLYSCMRHGYEGALASEFSGATIEELGAAAPAVANPGAPRLPWQAKMDSMMSQSGGGVAAGGFGGMVSNWLRGGSARAPPRAFGDIALDMLAVEPVGAYERAQRRQLRLITLHVFACAAVLARSGAGAKPEVMLEDNDCAE